MNILHTSISERGQIYIPTVNWALLIMVIVTTVEFGESVNLAAAYGISVSSTMLITTILLSIVMRREWHINPIIIFVMIILFFVIDFAFWTATLIKIKAGGWYQLPWLSYFLLASLHGIEAVSYCAISSLKNQFHWRCSLKTCWRIHPIGSTVPLSF